jgi:hypothetical protein
MANPHGSAPAWLFSFVDLAFLILIAMTQISDLEGGQRPLRELVVPKVDADSTAELPPQSGALWQLRIHDRADAGFPFEIVGPGATSERADVAGLRTRLDALLGAGEDRPIVAPHPDSRSEDLLEAVGLVEERWPSRRRAIVELAANP